MPAPRHTIFICRHGDTEYSPTRRLAGSTDLDLTAAGEANARQVAQRLAGIAFDRVWTSPRLRARRTAELAGFADRAVIDARIAEMSFGDYEGHSVPDIRRTRPGWSYLRDGCPGGESPAELGARVDAFLADARGLTGVSLLFAHSVVSRVLTARYLGYPVADAGHFMMSPGAISVLGYDPIDDSPAIVAWNDRGLPLAAAVPA
jgi:broad specificity phosphatase PhoE